MSEGANTIGSRNSAFQPYKAITVLTNLQRGNVKTSHREISTQSLTFHEKAARGELTQNDLNQNNVDAVDENGKTALMWACFHSHLPTVLLLLSAHSSPNFRGRQSETPLMYASANGHLSVINTLLSSGAEVNSVDNYGNSPLTYATLANHPPSITALLTQGADPLLPNFNGDTPFSIAVSKSLHAAQHAMESYIREEIERRTK